MGSLSDQEGSAGDTDRAQTAAGEVQMSHGPAAWGAGALRGCCSDKIQEKKALSQRVQCVAAHLQCGELYKAWLRAGSPWRFHCATAAWCQHSPQCTGRGVDSGVELGTWRGLWHGHRQESQGGNPDGSVGSINEQSCAQSSQPSRRTWPGVEHGWHRHWAASVGHLEVSQ